MSGIPVAVSVAATSTAAEAPPAGDIRLEVTAEQEPARAPFTNRPCGGTNKGGET